MRSPDGGASADGAHPQARRSDSLLTPVVIALGSNLGEREANLERGLQLLSEAVRWERVSTFLESAPMYETDQPTFLNAVARGETAMGPIALFRMLKAVEQAVGRTPGPRYGPRVLDLDLIQYGVLELRSDVAEGLVVPHPHARERDFVMIPWREIDPLVV
ncbi:2-amino-4-hydroxy-6-hydroxymethyldihydropteridine diphosphokinase [Armatimonadetes bacterium Uphvl-Ar2]|nr:2-amino-4-hydroxy-6-hydroxymethyldihydropteridine diphosphokinase [Armatimonadetes bacterium Uphvl-Ar2]